MCFDTECHIDFKGSKYAFSGPSGVIWWNLYERYLIKFLLAKIVFPPFGVPFRLKRLAFNICLITSAQAKMHSYSQTAISFGRNIGLDIIKQEDFTRVPTLDLWKSLQITQNVKLTPSCSLHSNYCICVVFFKTTYSLYFLLPTSALPSKICFMSVQSCHRHLQINVSHSFDLGKFIMRTLQVFHVSAFHTFILPTLFSS